MKVKSESEVAQSCLTPSDPVECSLPGSSIHGIFQARVLEWGAIAFCDLILFTSVVSNSVRPHKQQPTRLPCPWDSPGKNTGVGCHFPLQCRKVKVKVTSCLTVSDPMDCSLPGSSIHGSFQARVLEWDAMAFSSAPKIKFYFIVLENSKSRCV